MANPLDGFTSPVAAGAFKLPELPKLASLRQDDYATAYAKFDEQMSAWGQRLEQLLNERFQAKETPTGKIE